MTLLHYIRGLYRQSKEEWERDQRMRKDWQEQMDAAIRESLDEKIHLEGLHRREQELLEQALSKVNNFGFLRIPACSGRQYLQFGFQKPFVG